MVVAVIDTIFFSNSDCSAKGRAYPEILWCKIHSMIHSTDMGDEMPYHLIPAIKELTAVWLLPVNLKPLIT